jgi:hypothetical protein
MSNIVVYLSKEGKSIQIVDIMGNTGTNGKFQAITDSSHSKLHPFLSEYLASNEQDEYRKLLNLFLKIKQNPDSLKAMSIYQEGGTQVGWFLTKGSNHKIDMDQAIAAVRYAHGFIPLKDMKKRIEEICNKLTDSILTGSKRDILLDFYSFYENNIAKEAILTPKDLLISWISHYESSHDNENPFVILNNQRDRGLGSSLFNPTLTTSMQLILDFIGKDKPPAQVQQAITQTSKKYEKWSDVWQECSFKITKSSLHTYASQKYDLHPSEIENDEAGKNYLILLNLLENYGGFGLLPSVNRIGTWRTYGDEVVKAIEHHVWPNLGTQKGDRTASALVAAIKDRIGDKALNPKGDLYAILKLAVDKGAITSQDLEAFHADANDFSIQQYAQL